MKKYAIPAVIVLAILAVALSAFAQQQDRDSQRQAMRERFQNMSEEERAKKGIGLGVIEAGAYADILVVNGDPIADIKLLRDRDNLQLIMKDGGVWKNTLIPATHPQHVPSTKRHTPGGSL